MGAYTLVIVPTIVTTMQEMVYAIGIVEEIAGVTGPLVLILHLSLEAEHAWSYIFNEDVGRRIN